jgi:hypothetical protein
MSINKYVNVKAAESTCTQAAIERSPCGRWFPSNPYTGSVCMHVNRGQRFGVLCASQCEIRCVVYEDVADRASYSFITFLYDFFRCLLRCSWHLHDIESVFAKLRNHTWASSNTQAGKQRDQHWNCEETRGEKEDMKEMTGELWTVTGCVLNYVYRNLETSSHTKKK